MLFIRSLRIMQRVENAVVHHSKKNGSTYTYEATIETLNSLQSNATYLKNVSSSVQTSRKNNLKMMREFVIRSGMNFESLDKLSIIHVTGTKGKGSTCAYCESILREHGVKTGFFSSPHLVNVTERIKINGQPVNKNQFTKHFWQIYNNLLNNKFEYMPIYFEMLVLVALKVFMAEKVDVAVIEVGIGGEYDSTNILRIVPIAGITSLGFDHTALLGNTIDKIAWNKSGIMKTGAKVFTVPQELEAINVLKDRSIEKQCELIVVEQNDYDYVKECIRPPYNILGVNASLGVKLAETWLQNNEKLTDLQKIKSGLRNTQWQGRYQIVKMNKLQFYLDGAHTEESLQNCLKWFKECTKNSKRKKALMFNNTGNRDSRKQLGILSDENFDIICFTPNTAISVKSADSVNFNHPDTEQLDKCLKHRDLWLEFNKDRVNLKQEIILKPTVLEALTALNDDEIDILVTGSLHLVGATLSLIDPDLRIDELKFGCDENNKIRNIY